jgi:putative lipoic acid-binding regulatory protein
MSIADPFHSLREKIKEQYTWPSLYMFKFIVPQAKVDEVKQIFPKHEVQTKPSSKGTYVSVTAKVMANSTEEIIAIYQKAQSIKGIISL